MLVPTQFNWSSVIGSGLSCFGEASWNCRLALQQNGEFSKTFPPFHTLIRENEAVSSLIPRSTRLFPTRRHPTAVMEQSTLASAEPRGQPDAPLSLTMNEVSWQPWVRLKHGPSVSVSQQSAIITPRPSISVTQLISRPSWKLLLKGGRQRKQTQLRSLKMCLFMTSFRRHHPDSRLALGTSGLAALKGE